VLYDLVGSYQCTKEISPSSLKKETASRFETLLTIYRKKRSFHNLKLWCPTRSKWATTYGSDYFYMLVFHRSGVLYIIRHAILNPEIKVFICFNTIQIPVRGNGIKIINFLKDKNTLLIDNVIMHNTEAIYSRH
jgi:hypothetical protein